MRAYVAAITLVDGLITDAGRSRPLKATARRYYMYAEGPYDRGKKTMAYELGEHRMAVPDCIIYPTAVSPEWLHVRRSKRWSAWF